MNEQRTEGELGWILNKNYWRKGYGTEAAMAVKDFAINDLRVFALIAHCDYRNSASRNIMEKIGLRLIKDNGVRPEKISPPVKAIIDDFIKMIRKGV